MLQVGLAFFPFAVVLLTIGVAEGASCQGHGSCWHTTTRQKPSCKTWRSQYILFFPLPYTSVKCAATAKVCNLPFKQLCVGCVLPSLHFYQCITWNVKVLIPHLFVTNPPSPPLILGVTVHLSVCSCGKTSPLVFLLVSLSAV